MNIKGETYSVRFVYVRKKAKNTQSNGGRSFESFKVENRTTENLLSIPLFIFFPSLTFSNKILHPFLETTELLHLTNQSLNVLRVVDESNIQCRLRTYVLRRFAKFAEQTQEQNLPKLKGLASKSISSYSGPQ